MYAFPCRRGHKGTHGRTTRREQLGSHLSVLARWIGKPAMETPNFANYDLLRSAEAFLAFVKKGKCANRDVKTRLLKNFAMSRTLNSRSSRLG